ncbi:hypothetical protein FRC11_003979 [Ceratobasidium sp. 423]|nr:hypothetical protein FRC11_003979 [Ceratobasidium sp. 423]
MALDHYNKWEDIYRYVKAEEFFNHLDNDNGRTYQRIRNVEAEPGQFDPQRLNVTHDACYRGLAFRDDMGKIFIIQFVRPTTFRVLFNPENNTLNDYKKENSRNIIRNTFEDLVETLDKFENTDWEVGHDTQTYSGYIVLESRFKKHLPIGGNFDPDYACRIIVRKKDCQITALRRVSVYNTREEALLQQANLLRIDSSLTEKVIWQTKPCGILYSGKMSLLEIEKPPTARYLGFGEQGGRQVLKSKQICDFFNFDNMTYSQVYNQGPLDSREPLYHSEPFWMEIAQHPGYQLKLATFIDNFSQVCLDIGSKNNSMMRVATRFGYMRMYVVAADTISKLINSYTSIVGRPNLKPRYVLGYHQGCYGYETGDRVREVVRRYQEEGFPIDGMHIDVDLQRGYRTFTINTQAFNNPKELFRSLRDRGVKCGTNITPYINNVEDGIRYQTLEEGTRRGYFIKDYRHKSETDGPQTPLGDRYMVYRGGEPDDWYAASLDRVPKNKYQPQDTQQLYKTWHTGKPFQGGVYYGANLGNVKRSNKCSADPRFPFRLRVAPNEHRGGGGKPEKPVIEVWSLYSLNLHEATYNGWNNNLTRMRQGKRNFIIGRGGFIGLHRYAGLWTGDNASTWDFLKVSVTQILALGLSGITISGGDVGGFEPDGNGEWANPELLMRWYLAYCLLPWFRNHYNGKTQMNKKAFQEPYRYIEEIHRVKDPEEHWMYRATLPVCKYYVRLRYSLLQLLYDQMFDNLLTGLPIARSLVISNEDDGSLVTENEGFLDNTYTVGDDVLVAPVLWPQLAPGRPKNQTRIVYLPRPDSWWQFNLRADGPDAAVRLDARFDGGTLLPYDASMDEFEKEGQIPYMNPMFIRYGKSLIESTITSMLSLKDSRESIGAIIPQIEPRQYAEDWAEPNPVAIHVYPGRIGFNKSYDMYLDDGVSRKSAPTADNLQKHFAENEAFNSGGESRAIKSPLKRHEIGDSQAGNVFWRVRILQETKPGSGDQVHRNIYLETLDQCPESEFDPTTQHGPVYRLFIWGPPDRKREFCAAKIKVVTLQKPQRPKEIRPPRVYEYSKNARVIELDIKEVGKFKHRVEVDY